jgi:hypothetical protein
MTDRTWVTVQRPGYFGAERDAMHACYNDEYGEDGWRLAWQGDGRLLSRREMSVFYEHSYLVLLRDRADILDELVGVASDVYDDSPTNVASGLDYAKQETDRTHVQDIAIRRAVRGLGRTFVGPELLQIRDALGDHPLSLTLSPGRVPFCRPDLLLAPELEGWWLAGSVESFYQSNKLLQRRVSE